MSSGRKAVRGAQKYIGLSPHTPVVFDSPLAREWTTSGVWTPRNLAKLSPKLQVKQSKDKHFMYIEGGRNDLLQDEGELTSIVDMETSFFFDKCSKQMSSNISDDFHYFTGRVADCFPSLLHADWEQFTMEDVHGVTNLSALGYMSVWLGGLGSTTQSHYDIANNCFLQVNGSKRIRLWHPKVHIEMCPYPDAHPRARKSRLSPMALDQLEPFLDVVLEPGDALFIPPFWFHHVEVVQTKNDPPKATTPSVSLNVFSQAHISRGFGAALGLPPPQLSDSAAYSKLMGALARELGISPSICYDIYSSRYEPPKENFHLDNLEDEIYKAFVGSSELTRGAARYVEAFKKVFEELEPEDPEYVVAVRNICFAHLSELIALKNFGASRVGDSLKTITRLCV